MKKFYSLLVSLFIVLCFNKPAFAQCPLSTAPGTYTNVFTTTTSGCVIPTGVTSVTVECWGGGGGGGKANTTGSCGSPQVPSAGGGGGGGAYSVVTNYPVVANGTNTLTFTVGGAAAGGSGSGVQNGVVGNPSSVTYSVGSTVICRAAGGGFGAGSNGIGAKGLGGAIANNIPVGAGAKGGDGANGTQGAPPHGGGGGGGAGNSSSNPGGNAASGTTGGATGTGNPGGTATGGGCANAVSCGQAAGGNGLNYGAGGAGGAAYYVAGNATSKGGNGAPGYVRITYTVAAAVCNVPAPGITNPIGTNGATVNWTCGSCTGSYIIEYGLTSASFSPGGAGTAGSANSQVVTATAGTLLKALSGLAQGTQYDFYIRQDCGSGSYSSNCAKQQFTTTCGTPASQATGVTFSNVTATSMTVSWTRGTPSPGDGVIVLIHTNGAVSSSPVNGTTYTAVATPTGGTPQIGTGNYVIFQGAGTSVNLTGLSANTSYSFAVYEKNCSGGSILFNTTSPALGTQTTYCSYPSDVYTSGTTWTIPNGVTSIQVECWGGGGGGGGANPPGNCSNLGGSGAGGGGGGGAYSKTSNYSVTPGQSVTITVGTGGGVVSGANGIDGNPSSVVYNFNSATIASAAGGAKGLGGAGANSGGAGGSTGVGFLNKGGNGASGVCCSAPTNGGGGGGGAGNGGLNLTPGLDGSGTTGGNGGTGNGGTNGGRGGGGGSSTSCSAAAAPGLPGNTFGAGGGGAGAYNQANNNGNQPGGIGGNGRVIITYGNPAVTSPTTITFTAGTEPTCQLTSAGTTTDYNSTATVGTLLWSLTNISNTAGTILTSAIDASTGVVTWPNGWAGSVRINVQSTGCGGPTTATTHDVTVNTPVTWYIDADGDTYYPATQSSCASPGAGWTTTAPVGGAGDCNDANINIHPNTVWRLDADGDLYYTGTPVTQCASPGAGYTFAAMTGSGDCNDNNSAIHPGATEICGDGFDNDCAGGDLACGPNTWKGGSTVWGEATNWTVGVPNGSLDGTIPSVPVVNASNFPVITTGVTINNLNIATSATLTVNSGGALTLNGTLSNSGAVTIQSGANFLQGNSSSYTGSGTFTVERFVSTSADGYRDISSPVAATVADLADDFPVFGQNGVQCWYAYNPYPNVQVYDEALSIVNGAYYEGWKSHTGTGNPLTPLQGVAIRTYNGAPFTVDFTGTPNNGAKSIAITNTPSVTTSQDGWNFVGNPYPSNIDWVTVAAMNPAITGSYYIFGTTGEYTGAWGTCNAGGACTGLLGITRYISAGQGFFVKANTTNGSFVIDNTARTATAANFYKTGAQTNELRLTLSDNINSDEILAYTDANATTGNDQGLDAQKIAAGSTVYISFSQPDNEYAINVLNEITEQTVLPLVVWVKDTGSYNFALTEQNLTNLTPYLKDALTGTETDLTVNTPALNLNGSETYNRYSVVFRTNVTTGIKETEQPVKIYSNANEVFISRANNSKATVTVSNILGQQITETTTNSELTTLKLNGAEAWYAIVKVKEGSKVTVAKVLISNK